jgi:hypothetical protein
MDFDGVMYQYARQRHATKSLVELDKAHSKWEVLGEMAVY